MSAPRTLTEMAPAKVNLFLRVLGVRSDGYHELETLIVPISAADRLRVHAVSDPASFRNLSLSLEVTGDPALTAGVPVDESNLVMRAARELGAAADIRGFAEFALHKEVPRAGGLGGGSADAAATLRALNSLWETALDTPALTALAARIGSDVPALIGGGPQVARGRGEIVEPAPVPAMELALATFASGVFTAEAFRWWDEDGGPTGPDPLPLIERLRHPAGGGNEGPDWDLGLLQDLVFNDLEGPVMLRRPAVREVKELLIDGGALAAMMCGSGPSVAAILPPGTARFDPDLEREVERLSGRSLAHVRSQAPRDPE